MYVEIITAYNDAWPLIVSKPWAQGHFVLIGDSHFFHNMNFEGDENHDINNIQFFKRLLDHVSADGEGQ